MNSDDWILLYPNCWHKTFVSSASPGKVYHVFLVEEGAVSILLVAVVMFLFYLLPWGSIYLNQIMCLRICFWIHPPSSMQSGLRNPNQRNPSFLTIAYWVGGRLIDAKYVLSWEVLSTVNFFCWGSWSRYVWKGASNRAISSGATQFAMIENLCGHPAMCKNVDIFFCDHSF